jgi:AraC-like DNA-binding protein
MIMRTSCRRHRSDIETGQPIEAHVTTLLRPCQGHPPTSATIVLERAQRTIRAAFPFSLLPRRERSKVVDDAQRVTVEEMAASVRMSASSFHQRFKAVTSMSPSNTRRCSGCAKPGG